jgi:hypothetical protein
LHALWIYRVSRYSRHHWSPRRFLLTSFLELLAGGHEPHHEMILARNFPTRVYAVPSVVVCFWLIYSFSFHACSVVVYTSASELIKSSLGRVAGGPHPQHELSLRGIFPPELFASLCGVFLGHVVCGFRHVLFSCTRLPLHSCNLSVVL